MQGQFVLSDLDGGGGSVTVNNTNVGAATTIASLLETFFSGGTDNVNVTVNGALTMTAASSRGTTSTSPTMARMR